MVELDSWICPFCAVVHRHGDVERAAVNLSVASQRWVGHPTERAAFWDAPLSWNDAGVIAMMDSLSHRWHRLSSSTFHRSVFPSKI